MANKKLWNDNWEFYECPVENKAVLNYNLYNISSKMPMASDISEEICTANYQAMFKYYEIPEEADLKPVDVPHDWMIYDTKNLYRDSIGWYHKTFFMNKEEVKSRVSLRFDGVYMDSAVFINNKQAYEWKYGYSAFEFDISEFLQEGQNEVWVRVVFLHCNSRWYSGAGIYRNVWLKTYEDEHLLADGVYITTVPLADDEFSVEFETEIHMGTGNGERILRQSIYGPDKQQVASVSMHYGEGSSVRTVAATQDFEEALVFLQSVTVKNPL